MTYDKRSGRTLLFGGVYQTFDDPIAPAGSAPCWADRVVLEPDRVIEGDVPLQETTYRWERHAIDAVTGDDGRRLYAYCFNDTWAFDGATQTWTPLDPVTDPEPRFDAAIASDWTCVPTGPGSCGGEAGKPTLFGGCTGIGLWGAHGDPNASAYWDCSDYAGTRGASTFVDDTSTVQPSCATSPTTCDPTRNGQVRPNSVEREVAIGDTWVYDGTYGTSAGTWRRICPNQCTPVSSRPTSCSDVREDHDRVSLCAPSQRLGAVMAYNPATREMILTGGYNFDPKWKYVGWRIGGAVWAFAAERDLTAGDGRGCRDTDGGVRQGPCWRMVLSQGMHSAYSVQTATSLRGGSTKNCNAIPGAFHRGNATGTIIGGKWHALVFGGEGDADHYIDPVTRVHDWNACPTSASTYDASLLYQTWYWDDSNDPATPDAGCPRSTSNGYSTVCWRRGPSTGQGFAWPKGRRDATLAFDHARGRTVLTGGLTFDRSAGVLVTTGDTWAYTP